MSSLLAHNPPPPPSPSLYPSPHPHWMSCRDPGASWLDRLYLSFIGSPSYPPSRREGEFFCSPKRFGGEGMENGRVMEFKLMLQEAISSRHLASLWTEPKEMRLHPTPPLFFKSNWERFFPHSTLAKNDSFFFYFFYFCFRTTTIRAWLRTESSPGRKGRGRK